MFKSHAKVFKLGLCAIALALVTACGTKDDDKTVAADPAAAVLSKNQVFNVKLEWLTGPKTGENNSAAKLIFTDAAGNLPTSTSAIGFKPWMDVHGHGSPMGKQTIEVDPTSANIYVVKGINFIMGGVWQLGVTATVNGLTDEATVVTQVQ